MSRVTFLTNQIGQSKWIKCIIQFLSGDHNFTDVGDDKIYKNNFLLDFKGFIWMV